MTPSGSDLVALARTQIGLELPGVHVVPHAPQFASSSARNASHEMPSPSQSA